MNLFLQEGKYYINGLTLDDLVNLTVHSKSFIKYLRDIQNYLRILRGIQKDEGDRYLIQADFIDDLIGMLDEKELESKIEEVKNKVEELKNNIDKEKQLI